MGFNYQRTSYDTFEGQNLDDGSIKFYLRHNDCCTFRLLPQTPFFEFSGQRGDGSRLTPPFEGDLIEAALSFNATTHTTAVFANYGVTDRWDVGVAVPFVRVNIGYTAAEGEVAGTPAGLTTTPLPDESIIREESSSSRLSARRFSIQRAPVVSVCRSMLPRSK